MDYHQDKFQDASLMIYNNHELVALLPANKVGDELFSHQGLTYGGILFTKTQSVDSITAVISVIIEFLKANHIASLTIKQLPEFYYETYAKDIYNVLQTYNSEIILKQVILAIDYQSEYNIHKTKLKRFNKLKTNGFRIVEGQHELERFWNTVLIKRLDEKHDSKPVHNLAEIQYLQDKFPSEILQYTIYNDTELLAGITIFKKGKVVKSQYGMASETGEKLKALDMLFVYLIRKYEEEGLHFFSMGTVSNDSKLGYSQGMLKQKQELGCKTFNQDILKVAIHD